jgi:hypothetical protein
MEQALEKVQKIGLLALTVIAGIYLLTMAFSKRPDTSTELFKLIGEQYEERLKAGAQEREALAREIKSYEALEAQLNKRDSVLILKINQYQGEIKKIHREYEALNRFDNYNSADIIRFFRDSLYSK